MWGLREVTDSLDDYVDTAEVLGHRVGDESRTRDLFRDEHRHDVLEPVAPTIDELVEVVIVDGEDQVEIRGSIGSSPSRLLNTFVKFITLL
ncbi:hypothetical protein MLP_14870 [Microlunatus phosphovorus NM-1]|uniref:Uncharacterized protein n=2 Tax=Microlunatus phosphovorus TaxID=29405 RepID=F5XQK1_MICPN|nr:hypothetical protein MLP_14870 [Microlunatus phosphovorus NM-1]